jgi:hypothetical protein
MEQKRMSYLSEKCAINSRAREIWPQTKRHKLPDGRRFPSTLTIALTEADHDALLAFARSRRTTGSALLRAAIKQILSR